MATFSRVSPEGWQQGDDASAFSRVSPDGWEQGAAVGGGGPTYTLAADSGTFSYTGGDASFVFTRKLAADSGTFSYSGGDAALSRGWTLAADSGTFAYTGGDATLTYTPVGGSSTLAADGGTFSYTGGDATIAFNRALIADSGSFGYTGGDATFTRARTLAADGGTFAYSGGDATLTWTRAYTLTAESGSFTLSGGDAELTYSAEPVVAPAVRRRGHATPWIAARKRLALQTWWDYLTEETPAESTQRVIKEVKAGRPIPEVKPPKGPESISAEKLADKIIPSRLWAAQNLIVDNVDVQRVVRNAIRIAQERDDEEILMLL